MKKVYIQIFLALFALAATSTITSAQSQEVLKLKLTHPLPATHFLWVEGMKKLTDSVTEKTNGKVQFEVYPASQLGTDHFTALKSGLADVAMIVTPYYPDKFPLTSVTELPGMYSTSCEATNKYWQLAKPGGVLDKYEYAPRGIHILLASTLPPYSLSTVSKKIETIDDLSGKRIWATGAAQDKTIRSIGAVPVRMIASELFESISRGTLDGVLMNYIAHTQYKLETKLHYSVQGVELGSGSWVMAMNEKAWQALPKDLRDTFTTAGATTQTNLCKWMDTESQKSLAQVTAAGMVVSTLSPAQQTVWKTKISTVAADWAAEMNAAGKNGTELLEAMRKASGEAPK
jgi:TRAP-type C4-dicarboxylate transport system substrate-binding protein